MHTICDICWNRRALLTDGIDMTTLILVIIASGNGVLLDGTEPLHEEIMTYYQLYPYWQFESKYIHYHSGKWHFVQASVCEFPVHNEQNTVLLRHWHVASVSRSAEAVVLFCTC